MRREGGVIDIDRVEERIKWVGASVGVKTGGSRVGGPELCV